MNQHNWLDTVKILAGELPGAGVRILAGVGTLGVTLGMILGWAQHKTGTGIAVLLLAFGLLISALVLAFHRLASSRAERDQTIKRLQAKVEEQDRTISERNLEIASYMMRDWQAKGPPPPPAPITNTAGDNNGQQFGGISINGFYANNNGGDALRVVYRDDEDDEQTG